MSKSVSPSDSESENRYALRFPFRPLHKVTDLVANRVYVVDGLEIRLWAENPLLVLRVEPFRDQEEAWDYIPHLWGALARLSIVLRTGFIVNLASSSLLQGPRQSFHGKGMALDNQSGQGVIGGDVDWSAPMVIPVSRNVMQSFTLEATGTVMWSAEIYVAELIQGLNRGDSGANFHEPKLRTAVELMSEVQSERSMRAKLLTCVMALEVLAKPIKRSDVVQSVLDGADAQVAQLLSGVEANSPEWNDLVSLQNEIRLKRESSLGGSIERMVKTDLKDLPAADLAIRGKEIKWAYARRSKLVHRGTLPEAELERAFEIAHATLREILARRIGLVPKLTS